MIPLHRLSELAAMARHWDMDADFEVLDAVMNECPEPMKERAAELCERVFQHLHYEPDVDPWVAIMQACEFEPAQLPFVAAYYWADRIAVETWEGRR